ncbi:MAG: hypothetical protein JWO15_3734 [Sphingomonadales bacterium]|nr:hypothetical protein [Sphingomonadales bacterium]
MHLRLSPKAVTTLDDIAKETHTTRGEVARTLLAFALGTPTVRDAAVKQLEGVGR